MKKAVVTGGAGFIGSNLVDELAVRDYHVVIFDNLSTGKMSNIRPALDGGNAEFIEGDITDFPSLKKAFSGAEYVFHQAALPSVPRSIEDPEATNTININGTLNVLLAARDCGVKKVVYASSSSVYGDTPELPKREDMTPNPLSPYAVTKLAGEYYCMVFQKVYGLNTVSLRYFNVYGPRQDPDSPYAAVIPLFFRQALDRKPLTIFGDGEQSRDFTFVKDVVTANIQAAESQAAGVYNLGTGQSVTVNRLAELVARIADNPSLRPEYLEMRSGDILHSLADISLAGTFGYKPQYSLEESLKLTFRDYIKTR